jgi:hypothetical protein
MSPHSIEHDVRQSIFKMMSLLGGIFACFVITPGNIIEGLPLVISIGVFIFGAGFIGVYWASRRWHVYPYSLAALLLLGLLNYAWFFNYGSKGPISLIFFSAPMLFTVLFKGWKRWFFNLLFVANAALLYLVEYKHPSWVGQYSSDLIRLEDCVFTIPLAALMCVLMVNSVMRANELEHRRLELSKAELEKTMAEMRVLKGLLPVCASCKKVRTSDGGWTQMETYIERHSEASFSHGLCPDCIPLYMDKDSDA